MVMKYKCCVPDCPSASGGRGISMFSFPRDPERRKVWQEIISIKEITRYTRICILHFREDMCPRTFEILERFSNPSYKRERPIMLRHAVPCIFSNHSYSLSDVPEFCNTKEELTDHSSSINRESAIDVDTKNYINTNMICPVTMERKTINTYSSTKVLGTVAVVELLDKKIKIENNTVDDIYSLSRGIMSSKQDIISTTQIDEYKYENSSTDLHIHPSARESILEHSSDANISIEADLFHADALDEYEGINSVYIKTEVNPFPEDIVEEEDPICTTDVDVMVKVEETLDDLKYSTISGNIKDENLSSSCHTINKYEDNPVKEEETLYYANNADATTMSPKINSLLWPHRTDSWDNQSILNQRSLTDEEVRYTISIRPPETDEQCTIRLEKNRIRAKSARQRETPEQHQNRLLKNMAQINFRRQHETPEHRKIRLENNMARTNFRRQHETPEQRQIRLIKNMAQINFRRQHETPENRKIRLENNMARINFRRQHETPEQRQIRLMKNMAQINFRRQHETPEHRSVRLEKNRIRIAAYRQQETSEKRAMRLQKNRVRNYNKKRETTDEQMHRQTQDIARQQAESKNQMRSTSN